LAPAEEDTEVPPPAPTAVSSAADTLEHEAVTESLVRGVLIGIVGRLHSNIVPVSMGEGTLGRAPDNTYVIDDLYLSKLAARITVQEQGIAFECIEGAKGIEVNGQSISEPVWLRDGDRLKLGSTLFSFRTTVPEGA